MIFFPKKKKLLKIIFLIVYKIDTQFIEYKSYVSLFVSHFILHKLLVE